jgi:hypothetical protein
LETLCDSGARAASSSLDQLAELRAAVEPVYETLRADPATAAYLTQIADLAQSSTPRPLTIPGDCTGSADEGLLIVPDRSGELDGVYRWTITEEEHEAAMGPTTESFPVTFTTTLTEGHWTLELRDGSGATHTEGQGIFGIVEGTVTFVWPPPAPLQFTFIRDSDGSLALEPAAQMADDDAFVWSSHHWTKIG